MKQEWTAALVTLMREKIPAGTNLAGTLSEILCMGKEAIYRRLRGEVPFTFDEMVTISQRLNISLDYIVGNVFTDEAILDFNMLHSPDPYENYTEIQAYYLKLFDSLAGDPTSRSSTATNFIPYTLYAKYEHLSKFRLIRWMYQNEKIAIPTSLSDLEIPEELVRIHSSLCERVREVNETTFIWDANLFRAFVEEIRYFAGIGLVSREDVELMKKDLLDLIDEIEDLCIRGSFANGNKLQIYLSNINIEAAYSVLEKENFEICLFRVYTVNSMDSLHPVICNIQKNWIKSLKRHSTLISQSSEMQRMMFLNEQRSIVETL